MAMIAKELIIKCALLERDIPKNRAGNPRSSSSATQHVFLRSLRYSSH